MASVPRPRLFRRPRAGARALLVAVVLAPLVAACGGGSSDPGRPTVVVTTAIWGDVVAAVAGEVVEVEVLMPVGADPHTFEPSARDLAGLRDAVLVVANGAGLEEALDDALHDAADEGVAVLELADELSPIPLAGDGAGDADPAPDEDAEAGDEHHHAGVDPHVWMDPDRVASAARLIARELAARLDGRVDAGDVAALEANAEAYADAVAAVDEEIQARFADLPDARRKLVTSHDAFGYLAERYGFEVVGVVIGGGSTDGEPSAGELAALAAAVEEAGVPAIFTDSSAASAAAETLAAEVGEVTVVELYTEALGEPGSGAETLLGLLRTNAERIAEALAP